MTVHFMLSFVALMVALLADAFTYVGKPSKIVLLCRPRALLSLNFSVATKCCNPQVRLILQPQNIACLFLVSFIGDLPVFVSFIISSLGFFSIQEVFAIRLKNYTSVASSWFCIVDFIIQDSHA
ncbi:hypothetical protein PoB_001914000 [Plakobranchus ocellatus]|uniref:Uncharacterized protein n=1 Tax=Plakobranchus ocellatus TaxID=259542 RepID=A0AAV3ZDK6_9GAST|nr:hypothetical protein PoB_001914000 [Plakobranchus ocellatus]